MRVRFWGVRGTIPSPGPNTILAGGNTSCIDVLTSDKQLIILDAGTGIRKLGQQLAKEYEARITATLLISHTHWDHIQGFPFFFPAFTRVNRFVVIGQSKVGHKLEKILADQVIEPYLPFAYSDLEADLIVKDISGGEMMIVGDKTLLSAESLNHPGGCLGYRLENNGCVFTYCTDTTHPDDHLEENVLKLAQGADLLVHDAQFSAEQKRAFPTYGHSSWIDAAQVAVEAKVRCLALFHHDPDATDAELAAALAEARAIFPNTVLAQEGLTLNLPLSEDELSNWRKRTWLADC